MDCRNNVREMVRLLARPADQLAYEADVPIADAPSELICMFADDLFHPKAQEFVDAFSEEELKSLSELYGLLTIAAKAIEELDLHSVAEILTLPEWRAVMTCARNLESDLHRSWT